jgi:hypothetical protein
MIKKFSGVFLNQCTPLPQFETTCYLCDYVIAYEYFLVKADFIYVLYPMIYDYFISAKRWFKIYI